MNCHRTSDVVCCISAVRIWQPRARWGVPVSERVPVRSQEANHSERRWCAALFRRPHSSHETAEHVNRVKEETLRELKAVCSAATWGIGLEGEHKIKEELKSGAKLLAEGNLSHIWDSSGLSLIVAVRSQTGQTISAERSMKGWQRSAEIDDFMHISAAGKPDISNTFSTTEARPTPNPTSCSKFTWLI